MIPKFMIKLQNSADDLVRGIAGRLTPVHRIIFIVVMCLVFGFGSIYITVSSIYNLGKAKGERMQIEHIQRMELEKSNVNKEKKDKDYENEK